MTFPFGCLPYHYDPIRCFVPINTCLPALVWPPTYWDCGTVCSGADDIIIHCLRIHFPPSFTYWQCDQYNILPEPSGIINDFVIAPKIITASFPKNSGLSLFRTRGVRSLGLAEFPPADLAWMNWYITAFANLPLMAISVRSFYVLFAGLRFEPAMGTLG